MPSIDCPSAERLSGYVACTLSPDEVEAVESHLATCTLCEASVETLESRCQPPLAALQEPAPDDPRMKEPHLVAALADAERVGAAGGSTGSLPASLSSLTLPCILGPYELVKRIGEGGMGTVFLARHTVMNRLVALKVVRPERLTSAGTVHRFQREVQAAAQLSHRNIVHAYDAAQVGETHFLVMEYVEGDDLSRLVRRAGPLPVPEACEFACQAAQGLHHLHEKGLVHRDIKPSNLMLTPDGTIKVLDVGLARVEHTGGQGGYSAGPLTADGVLMGTPGYMAPEQIEAAHQVDHRADIYSLGCTLYFLLTGQEPFPGSTLSRLNAHLNSHPKELRQLRPDLPRGLEQVVNRMMARYPADRYVSMADVVEALRPFAQPPVPQPKTAPARRWKVVAAVALFLALPLLVTSVVIRLKGKDGTVIVRVMEPDVEVLVDGVSATVKSSKAGPIQLEPGEHEVIVKRGGETLYTKSFRLAKGETEIVTATWEPTREPQETRLPREVIASDRIPIGTGGRVAFSPDSRRVYYLGHMLRVWDLLSGKKTDFPREVLRDGGFTALAVPGQGPSFVTAGKDESVAIRNCGTGEKRDSFPKIAEGYIQAGAITPDGKYLVLSRRDRWAAAGETAPYSLWVWDVERKTKVAQLKGHVSECYFVAISPDGKHVLSGGEDERLCWWDVGNPQQPTWEKTINAEGLLPADQFTRVSAVGISPDGRLAASAHGGEPFVRLWTVAGDKLEERTQLKVNTPKEQVKLWLAFSPDSKKIASAGYDGRIVVWDLDSKEGKEVWSVKFPTQKLSNIAWAPDGKHLAVVSLSAVVHVLQLPTEAASGRP